MTHGRRQIRSSGLSETARAGCMNASLPLRRQPDPMSSSPCQKLRRAARIAVQVNPLVRTHTRDMRDTISAARSKALSVNHWSSYDSHSWRAPIATVISSISCDGFLGHALGVFMMYATAVPITAWVLQKHAGVSMDLEADVPLGLGTLMALLLAFRLNISYSRWWEGRLLWGSAALASRSLVSAMLSVTTHRSTCEQGGRHSSEREVAGWLLAFASSLRLQLLGLRVDNAPRDMRHATERLLGADALAGLDTSSHPPLHALRQLRAALARLCETRREAGHSPLAVLALEQHGLAQSEALHAALQGCERLVSTPCAPGYVGVLRCAIFAFLGLLPFLILELSFGAIPVCLATSFVLLGAEDLAVQVSAR